MLNSGLTCHFWETGGWLVSVYNMPSVPVPSVLWRCWLGGRKGIRPVKTRSSAIFHWPCDVSCQLRSCQLPCNSAETTCTTVLNKSKLWSWRFKVVRCVINVHSTMTRSSRFHCLTGVINKPTTVELCIYHLYTDDVLWRNFLSPQCRNCLRDPDHVHLGNTHSSQDWDFVWPTRVQNFKSLALAVTEILRGV